jgi:pyoverdine/dityrosine biosynthesis protein Dit1
MAMARRIEKPADFLPLGVRQVGAICFAHSFGVFFGGKAIHHRKRDGLPFVFASENQNQNSFSNENGQHTYRGLNTASMYFDGLYSST